jgi:ECF sigma factor
MLPPAPKAISYSLFFTEKPFPILSFLKAKVVELRYFGGLIREEAAEVLSVSPDTVSRVSRLAKVWLP